MIFMRVNFLTDPLFKSGIGLFGCYIKMAQSIQTYMIHKHFFLNFVSV